MTDVDVDVDELVVVTAAVVLGWVLAAIVVTDVAPGTVTAVDGATDVVELAPDVVDGPLVGGEVVVVPGSDSSLSLPLPPVKITSETISSTTATAPAANATNAPGWFHQPPAGDSYSGW